MSAFAPRVVPALVALGLAIALAACGDVPAFQCDTDEQCGDGGRCEDDRACSFADDTCHSLRRYGGEGPTDVADHCIGETSGSIAQDIPTCTSSK